jgi:DUF1009 family protein
MEKIGLIAGNGRFPLLFAQGARSQSVHVTAVAHVGETLPELEEMVDKIFWIRVGQLGRLIKIFKEEGVRDVVMAGGIKKTRLFTGVRPDFRSLALLARVKEKKDDALLRAVAEELEREGITVRESTLYLQSMLVEKGTLTARRPTQREWEDIQFGWALAREIGRLDIGQCLVVKDQVVLAVEAIEGTDETIERAGRLGREGTVVIKICKPNQDLRFDVPAVGVQTLRSMEAVKASCLALEAGRSILLDKEETLSLADRLGIAVVGVEGMG